MLLSCLYFVTVPVESTGNTTVVQAAFQLGSGIVWLQLYTTMVSFLLRLERYGIKRENIKDATASLFTQAAIVGYGENQNVGQVGDLVNLQELWNAPLNDDFPVFPSNTRGRRSLGKYHYVSNLTQIIEHSDYSQPNLEMHNVDAVVLLTNVRVSCIYTTSLPL